MNDFASRQRGSKRWVGIGLVILLHVLLVVAIQTGLARKFVKVVTGPVEARLLEEKKPDLPPPPPPPPPKNLPPPPAYVPPVDVPVANAPVSTTAIAAVTTTVPIVPPPPVTPAPIVRVGPVLNAATSCQKPEYPSASRREEEEGVVQLRVLIDVDGRVIDSVIEKSSSFKRLDDATQKAMTKCQFKPGTLNGKPEQSWGVLKYTWRLE
jgi:protein TonB